MKKKNDKKSKLPIGVKILIVLLLLVSAFLIYMIFKLDVLPILYLSLVIAGIVIFDLISILLIIKKKKKRVVGIILSIIFIVVYGFGIYYLNSTYDFLEVITNSSEVAHENYVVVVRDKADYKAVNELRNQSVGIIKTSEDGYTKAITKLSNDVNFDKVEMEDSYELTDALMDKKIEAMLIEESQYEILKENYDGFYKDARIIEKFSVEVVEEKITKEVDITKDSFNVLITGIDTYGKINTLSRSDVNIVLSINPVSGKMSLVHIPRDYYVQLYKKNGLKDKLTHAGIYGAETSVKTIETLLDIDINYYVKFNFSSVIKIVDTLGGINVYSDQSFESGLYDDDTTETYKYVKGWNELNGKETLSFCRERYNISGGDLGRGRHQEAVIEAIINKVTSPTILSKYSQLLQELSSTFVTNLDKDSMTKFIKMQLDKNTKWDTTKLVMEGTSSNEYTFSYPRQKLYVMIPSEESIKTAKEQIDSISK